MVSSWAGSEGTWILCPTENEIVGCPHFHEQEWWTWHGHRVETCSSSNDAVATASSVFELSTNCEAKLSQ